MKPSMTSNMLPLQKSIEFLLCVYCGGCRIIGGVPMLSPPN
jgi:hypothetical protein